MSVSKSLLENGNVQVTEVTEIPRYQGFEEYDDAACECVREDFVEQNKVWITDREREGFKGVFDTGEDWEPEGKSVEDDIESFQKYLDETYGEGKYEAFALGAYIHSNVSFSITKGPDNRCRWDSGTVGFVGLNKECNYNPDVLASQLSDGWNGWIERIYVWDNYEEDVVDEVSSLDTNEEIRAFKDRMKEQYGVTEFKRRDC